METVRDTGALVVLDGQHGIGQVITDQAVALGILRAKVHGISAIGIRNSGHFGTAAYFTRRAAEAGCVALLCTNASPAMAPWGGREKSIGTNPWSIAAPAGRHKVVVMDLANTAVARARSTWRPSAARRSRKDGRPMPRATRPRIRGPRSRA
ncbi:hypothetical protein GCM10009789_61240 [Kribbella sancticallisti]|uniref:Malate/L-lactate dehydrogenase n=1 Tax=Kribbella sancticallisti TaxID=460087 RepID=A0ABN2E8X1_9ACTN